MKIRSITYFDTLEWPLKELRFKRAGNFIEAARSAYQAAGFEVQTTRFASDPFPMILKENVARSAVEFAKALEARVDSAGFDYASIGPALPGYLESYQVIPDVLASTERVFAAGIISSAEGGVSTSAMHSCARVIKANSGIEPDGFGNLRFAALANVPAHSPFLPAAYHDSEPRSGFAIAAEAADLAVLAFDHASSIEFARQELIRDIEKAAGEIERLGISLAEQHDLTFWGIDFSLAPFPSAHQSIGTAIEEMGVPGVGNHGSLAAVAILADAIDRSQYCKAGFNGVMLPVLEDTALAESAASGRLTTSDLLLYSAVCGTGLDTLPLPGSVGENQLYAVLFDLAALAQRLGKPLTARLMPIPGKKAGEAIEFNFEFFAKSNVMDLKSEPLSGMMVDDFELHLQNRNSAPG
jgi:uncharacterized protein (UPF0210 family)